MKNIFISRFTCVIITMLLFASPMAFAQKRVNNVEKYLESLPVSFKTEDPKPQKYVMTTEYIDYDLFGHFIKKMRITAEYTRGLENGHVKWNNVGIANSEKEDQPYPDPQVQTYMEDFTYVPSENVLRESFFEKIPQADIFIKNLIWDMVGIEGFAWWYWDSLHLNHEYCARETNSVVELAGEGTFENKDIRITWTGITEMNNEICAIIKFTVMNNPLSVHNDYIEVDGRSHYWGNIYVSLEDKQIEYAELLEDVLTDVKFPDQEERNKFNTIRNISLTRILN